MTKPCARCACLFEPKPYQIKHRTYYCKSCASKAAVVSARLHRETKRKNNNAYLKRMNPQQRSSYARRYRARHPEARLAHQAIQTAKRNGSLVKQPCEVCGSKNSHAHHDDYAKPLEVRWLCHEHHMNHHQSAMLKAREG